MQSSALNEILDRLNRLPEEDVKEIADTVLNQTQNMIWVPNPGPQTKAYFSAADELFYGGQAGGGKSDLIIGLSLTSHEKSLILRRINDDARSLAERMLEISNDRNGWNGQLLKYRNNGRSIDFAGCQHEDDKQRHKGKPHDLIAFDEIGDFTFPQFAFIKAWNRSATGHRCRVVCAGNPPTTEEGLWIIDYWAPWLDDSHPNPAEPGELRWFVMDKNDSSIEVDGPGEYEIDGEMVHARSRTFIRSGLEDNPDLANTDYDAVLSGLPVELRDAYRHGRFDKSIKSNPWQCIPLEWVKAAQERWKPKPPAGIPMCAIGVDVAQGGSDNNIIACRHDGWYAPLIVIHGTETPVGTDTAGIIVSQRRDNAEVVIDCGGGYGGSAFKHMKDNGIKCYPYKGSESTTVRTNDNTIGFRNVRTAAYWKFREALDPSQEGGSRISLPQDKRLLSDLSAPRYKTVNNVIQLENKEDLVRRIGRSTDYADAVVMAWWRGDKLESSYHDWKSQSRGKPQPKVLMGHSAARRKR